MISSKNNQPKATMSSPTKEEQNEKKTSPREFRKLKTNIFKIQKNTYPQGGPECVTQTDPRQNKRNRKI